MKIYRVARDWLWGSCPSPSNPSPSDRLVERWRLLVLVWFDGIHLRFRRCELRHISIIVALHLVVENAWLCIDCFLEEHVVDQCQNFIAVGFEFFLDPVLVIIDHFRVFNYLSNTNELLWPSPLSHRLWWLSMQFVVIRPCSCML